MSFAPLPPDLPEPDGKFMLKRPEDTSEDDVTETVQLSEIERSDGDQITPMMSYHWNDIYIYHKVKKEVNFVWYYNHFTVTGLRITSGQDPNGYNKAGDVHRANSSGANWSFNVGRKGSDSPADWYSSQCSSGSNTFSHNPDNLNFAFKGRMEIECSSKYWSGYATFVFDSVVIGQGHAGSSNNWWWGIPGSSNVGGHRIKSGGTFEGKKYWFEWRRGGENQYTNEVYLEDFYPA